MPSDSLDEGPHTRQEVLVHKEGTKIALSRKSRALSILPTSIPGRSGTARWEALLKKFHESHKVTCKTTPKEIPTISRNLKKFPTGSSYEGSWNLFGLSGKGTYVFPKKHVKYVGSFHDGLFHGEGELQYDCGVTVKGKWKKGISTEKTLVFADGLEYVENGWKYCRYPDRRYTVEYDEGLEPAGRTYETATQPTPDILPGFYDVGDGFYEPITKTVYKYDNLTAIVRSPGEQEQKWIVENCRHSPETSLGPCPFLYEDWKMPTVEKEDPPPPAARTTHYEEEPELHDPDAFYVGRRRSRRSVSRNRSFFGSRRATDAHDFYRPSYQASGFDRRASTVSRHSKQSSRQASMFYDSRQSTFSEAGYRISRATFESECIYDGDSGGVRPSTMGLVEPKRPPPNW